MKKLFAVLLAVAMLLSLGVTAFATGNTVKAKIVIADSPAGTSYVAYKLFDATTAMDGYDQEKLSYTVSDPWFSLLFNKDDEGNITPKDPAIKFKVTGDDVPYAIEAEEGYSPADFAKWIMTTVTEWPNSGVYTGITDADTGVCEIKNGDDALPQGYYLIAPAKQVPGTVTPGTTNFSYNKSTDAWTSAYDWGQLSAAEQAAFEKQENACYYKTDDTDKKIPVTEAYFNMLSETEQANYTRGDVYTHKSEIDEATFRGLSKASQADYTYSAIEYTLNAGAESRISDEAYTTNITDPAQQALYETKPAHYKLLEAANPDAVPPTEAVYSTSEFVLDSEYQVMSEQQKAQYNPTAGDAHVTKATITPAQYVNLGQSNVAAVRALQSNYTGQPDPAAQTTTQASTIPDSTQTASLANVLDGQITQVVNKNDMPLDKEVNNAGDGTEGNGDYDDNGTGVKVGDVLEYQISTKVPAKYDPDKYDYIFQVSDKMSEGLTFGKEITIKIGDLNDNGTTDDTADDFYPVEVVLKVNDDGTLTQTVKLNGTEKSTYTDVCGAIGEPFELVTTDKTLGGNELRLDGEDEIMGGNFTFELSIATASQALRQYAGQPLLIEYSATVNEEALGALLKNAAVLEYTDETGLHELDAETDNYLARIVIDKFETGNRSQKLAGAEFVLYTYLDANNEPLTDPDAVAQAIADGAAPKYYKLADGDGDADAVVSWVAENEATRAVTDANGFAQFPYLPDGIYYLKEVKAPTDYTRLLNDIEFVINGKDALDQRLTQSQAEDILSQVANVANTPGSSMPSTGGVGATLLTIGGVALMLAAGAFLVLRRRKEQE